ncbi:MAG: zinc ribbon domain-containing protein [Anaerolineae bacterium]|nr:zinc ribbon domain-containing protein [Anaerolineae bacterium]
MMSTERICPNCGERLAADWLFCENCGVALRASVPSAPGAALGPQTKRVDQKLWLILAAAVAALCCCATAAAGYWTRQSWFPYIQGLTSDPTQTAPADLPNPTTNATTSVPTEASLATATTSPPDVTKTAPTPTAKALTWQDDFSSKNSGWHVYEDADGYASYHEGGVFAIAVAQPDLELRSWPELPEGGKVGDVSVTVSGFKVEGEGWWGIICRYSDDDNYYQLGIDGPAFTVVKTVNGSEMALTQPEWIETDALNPDGYENGMIPVTMRCEGNTIEIEIDGVSVFKTQDSSLVEGEPMIYAASYDVVGDVDGYYIKVLFDNFQINARR